MASVPKQAVLQMVTFSLGSEEYAVDVMAVREIIELPEITRTVNAPPQLAGVCNLRGAVIPVISLRRCFGLPEPCAEVPGCVAVLDCAGELKGFVIDDVCDVIRVEADQILPPLDIAGEPWITGILNWNQRLVIVMNLEQIV